MSDMPWSKFFWADWESDPGLRLCSLAAQGLWMRMLCVCARHDPKGYLAINGNPLGVDAIARLAGVAETEAEILVAELDRNGVFSRSRSGCIYSRRMVKDEKRSKEGRKHKLRGMAEAHEKATEYPPPSRGSTRGPSPQKPEARSQKPPDSPPKGGGAEFAEFYEFYPRKVARGAAERAFVKARSLASQQEIVAGAKRYAEATRGKEPEYVAHPATWLNAKRWLDESPPPASATASKPPDDDTRRTLAEMRARLGYERKAG